MMIPPHPPVILARVYPTNRSMYPRSCEPRSDESIASSAQRRPNPRKPSSPKRGASAVRLELGVTGSASVPGLARGRERKGCRQGGTHDVRPGQQGLVRIPHVPRVGVRQLLQQPTAHADVPVWIPGHVLLNQAHLGADARSGVRHRGTDECTTTEARGATERLEHRGCEDPIGVSGSVGMPLRSANPGTLKTLGGSVFAAARSYFVNPRWERWSPG